MRRIPHVLRPALVLSLLLGSGAALHAQIGTPVAGGFSAHRQVTAGYVVNAPDQLLGFSAMFLGPPLGQWGVYVDAKFTLDSPAGRPGYDASVSLEQAQNFGDDYFNDGSAWTTFNLGAIRGITETFALYAGAGYSRELAYREYFDRERNRGRFGFYWIDDDTGSGSRVNLFAGAWFRAMQSVLFQMGVESAPRGFTVGAAYVLPVWR